MQELLSGFNSENLTLVFTVFRAILAVFGAYMVALWFAMIVWTFRDIRTRSQDLIVQVVATLIVVVFWVPGLIIYLILRPKETLAETYERSLEEEYMLQDIEGRDICPVCRQRIEQDFQLCPSCRTALRHECHSCQRLLDLNWSICPYCGTEARPAQIVRPTDGHAVTARE